jgi:uncharacterized protein
MIKPIRTPCVGICSTGIGDDVCRGCKRFAHEVIDWNTYDHSQRAIIARRLESFLVQVVQNKIEVIDQRRLLLQVKHQQVRFNPEQSPYCWAFDLLRAGASQLCDPSLYGLRVLPQWRDCSLMSIKEAIDADFYTLSCAYYERYIAPGENSNWGKMGKVATQSESL